MTFAEAIRLGSMLRPQGFGSMRSAAGTCALGAAEEALGRLWCDAFGDHRSLYHACPACNYAPDRLQIVTPAHLNDTHYWTREQIADWVETIERAHALQPEAVAVAK
jgi:hypothetical protein